MINKKNVTAVVISASDPFLLWIKLHNLVSINSIIKNVIIILDINNVVMHHIHINNLHEYVNQLENTIYPNVINYFKRYFDDIVFTINKSIGGTVGHAQSLQTILKFKDILSSYIFISEDDDFIINPTYVLNTIQNRIDDNVDVCACNGCTITCDHIVFIHRIIQHRTDLRVDISKNHFFDDISMSASSILLKTSLITNNTFLLANAINIPPGKLLEYKDLKHIVEVGGTVDVFGGICYSLFTNNDVKHITYFDLADHSTSTRFNFNAHNNFFHLGNGSCLLPMFLFADPKNIFIETTISEFITNILKNETPFIIENMYWWYHYIPIFYFLLNSPQFNTNGNLYNWNHYNENINYIIERTQPYFDFFEIFDSSSYTSSPRYNNIKEFTDSLSNT